MIVKKENEEEREGLGSSEKVEFSGTALEKVTDNPYEHPEDITYPEIVWKAAKVTTDALIEETEEATPRSIYLCACEFYLREFLDSSRLAVSEDDLSKILWDAMNTTAVESLLKKGLIDSMPSASGEAVYWITPEGKQRAQELGISTEPSERRFTSGQD
jgi:hypothetical protein